MANKLPKLELESFDSLFGMDETLDNKLDSSVKEIPLQELHEFKEHPFHVRADEELTELVESIKENGVIYPGICRMRPQGGYEIIAGHTRKRACELAGLDTIPMFVKNLNDDEATVVMVDSNIQREQILPSEKAKSYKMKFEALKHQGKAGGSSHKMIAEQSGESAKTIQRYISLAKLNDDFLTLLDNGRLGILQGVALSVLTDQEQDIVYSVIVGEKNLTTEQAEFIHDLHKTNNISEENIKSVFIQPKSAKNKNDKITLKRNEFHKFFSENTSSEEIKSIILQLLENWSLKERKE